MASKVSFSGFDGAELTGLVDRAEGSPRGGVLMAHCFTCSKDLTINARIARALASAGWHVLRFDFTGLGDSGGDFEGSTFAANVGDLSHAARWMLDSGLGPTALIGHSLGGAAVLVAAGKIRTVKSVVTIGAPATAGHVLHLVDDQAQADAHRDGCTFVSIAGRTFPLSDRFLHDLDSYDHQRAVAGLNRPLLVLHSPSDDIVPVSEGEQIFQWAGQPKSFAPLVGADHLLTTSAGADLASHLITDWLDRTAV